VVSVNSVRDI